MGVYQRLKASRLYDLYWRVADRSMIEDRQKEVDFYRALLHGFQNGNLIFDIGANHGTKTGIFLAMGARVVAVEPDPTNQQILRESFLKFRVTSKPVVIVGKAVSDAAGIETMYVDEPGSAKNSLSAKWVQSLRNDGERFGHKLDFKETREVETTTLETLIEAYGAPFFVKIDVEGHEPSVLRGLKRPVAFVSFEVNLPEFREEARQCIARLAELSAAASFNYAADCVRGLELAEWMPMNQFLPAFEACNDSSIEVFCRTPQAAQG